VLLPSITATNYVRGLMHSHISHDSAMFHGRKQVEVDSFSKNNSADHHSCCSIFAYSFSVSELSSYNYQVANQLQSDTVSFETEALHPVA
jgi:hypothetical protein